MKNMVAGFKISFFISVQNANLDKKLRMRKISKIKKKMMKKTVKTAFLIISSCSPAS